MFSSPNRGALRACRCHHDFCTATTRVAIAAAPRRLPAVGASGLAMRARAPGKVVLSGAYSVLDGAPAIVAAVDRYVTVDSSVAGDFLTDEVKAAGFSKPYWFDASPLRHDGRKLGLGSSAAILVATLAARALDRRPTLSPAALIDQIYPEAIEAHRIAQGGGSGIDVAAACHGGILQFCRGGGGATAKPLSTPAGLCIEVWMSGSAASTERMLAAVGALLERDSSGYERDIRAQAEASELTLRCWLARNWQGTVDGLSAQRRALHRLGIDAGIPIVTAEVQALAEIAERYAATVLPAGAGGGDIALYVGCTPSTFMDDDIGRFCHSRLPVALGAQGVHASVAVTDSGLP
jgi:phosphomevalonate kinase